MPNTIRTEKDSIGEKEVNREAYYGVQTLRAYENFNITGLLLHPAFIKSLAEVKKAAALANKACGLLSLDVARAIEKACDEIIQGCYYEEFIVDPIQGGAGTSMNMNANEVIANRAIELLGGQKGDYTLVHPNNHVNQGQSTNDVIPTAGRLTVHRLLLRTLTELLRLEIALEDKGRAFDGVIKMGRTQMQDAVPIRLGQEFTAYAAALRRCRERIENTAQEMLLVNLGGTAIGTTITADKEYCKQVVPSLSEVTGTPLQQSQNLIDSTQNLDSFVAISGVVKAYAVTLSKIASDLRLLSSGPYCGFGEINLPPRQNGSSIMPGKVNPVIPEVVNQVFFLIAGNDTTITLAAEAGQLELNAFEPVAFYCLFQSIETLGNAVKTFIDNCILEITANEEHCHSMTEKSLGIVTALVPYIGYQMAAELAKEAMASKKTVRALALEKELFTPEQLHKLLDSLAMTEPSSLHTELLHPQK